MPRSDSSSRTVQATTEKGQSARSAYDGDERPYSLNDVLDAVHAAALQSIGMIAEAERSAIVYLQDSNTELTSGHVQGPVSLMGHIVDVRGELPFSRFGVSGLVTNDLADAYGRLLAGEIKHDVASGVQPPGEAPRLADQLNVGLLGPSFAVGRLGEVDSRALMASGSPMIAGAGLAIQAIATNFDQLVDSMMPSAQALHKSSEAIVEAARRRATLRTQLLASGALSYPALARGRSMSSANVRQWVRRARERHELFTVEHQGETFVPAVVLDEDLSPRREYRPVIEALTKAGEDGWGLWAWLVFPSPWLDGAVPAEVLESDPERVVAAAEARASNAA